ncbi:MAG: phosphate acyltransferase PlsX [candidate division WS1 bacterium]|jgi:glycerol-3-phosphate acyltransferase PlsX|nr:phosphate acyltransferase PlsX [candidate division WS1 bacterium]
MRIAVDAMGGDFAPEQIVAGAVLAADEVDAQVSLVGRPEAIRACIGERPVNGRLEIEAAQDIIEMGESPRAALRGRDDSSIARAVGLVKDERAQAVVSAGNSGAFMAVAATRLGVVPGVKRPAIALTLPHPSGYRVLLDAGANADCKPEHLRDFGLMGSVYAQYTLGFDSPRVGLLSIGEETSKGNELTKAAHELLEAADLNFIGNVEGGDVFRECCDVIVCDGFVGNVVLKTLEGLTAMLTAQVREAILSNPALQSAMPAFEGELRRIANQFDAAEYGGALLLGVNGVAIVGHGCSDARAVRNAIGFAQRAVHARLVEHLSEVFAQRAEKSA